MTALDPDRWILDQLPHTCSGPNDCRACRIEEALAEEAPADACRHYGGVDCEWCAIETDPCCGKCVSGIDPWHSHTATSERM